jgi:hypothetical protein
MELWREFLSPAFTPACWSRAYITNAPTLLSPINTPDLTFLRHCTIDNYMVIKNRWTEKHRTQYNLENKREDRIFVSVMKPKCS